MCQDIGYRLVGLATICRPIQNNLVNELNKTEMVQDFASKMPDKYFFIVLNN